MENRFRTVVNLPDYHFDITHHHRVLLIGSCFADNIGVYFDDYKFPTCINPFGTLYNPVSVQNALLQMMEQKRFDEHDLLQHDDQWLSLDHNTRFANTDIEQCLNDINTSIEEAHEWLKNANYLFITWGTSWVYQYKPNGKVVANCHKIPATHFKRFRLDVKDITELYVELFQKLRAWNPGLQIIFTVSPVRHLKDGTHGNNLSKSVLFLAMDQLLEEFDCCHYFPAYELVMDELRDYRFYAQDMIHVAETGTKYVWERLGDAFFSSRTKDILNDLEKIIKAKQHHMVNAKDVKTKLFLNKMRNKVVSLQDKYRFIDFTNELNLFS